MEGRAGSGKATGIPQTIRGACQLTTDTVGKTIAATYEDSYYRTWYELQDADRMYFTPPKLTQSQMNVYLNHHLAGANWKDRLQGHYRQYAQDMRGIIRSGTQNRIPAKETQQAIRAKTGTRGESGLTYKIQRVMRTECNHAVNAARLSVFKRTGIEEYYYNSMLDDVSCTSCDDLDWKSHKHPFKIKNAKVGENFPPMHPNCRCWIDPVMSDKARQMMEKKGEKRRHLSYQRWYRDYVKV